MADKKKSNIKDQEQTNIVNETLDPKEKEQIQKLEAEANAIHESAQLLLDSEPNKQNPKQANSEDKSQQSVEKIQENHQNSQYQKVRCLFCTQECLDDCNEEATAL